MSVEFNDDENQNMSIGGNSMRMDSMGDSRPSTGPLVKLLFKWKLAKDESGASKVLIGVLIGVIALTFWMLHIAGVFGSSSPSVPISGFPPGGIGAPPPSQP